MMDKKENMYGVLLATMLFPRGHSGETTTKNTWLDYGIKNTGLFKSFSLYVFASAEFLEEQRKETQQTAFC